MPSEALRGEIGFGECVMRVESIVIVILWGRYLPNILIQNPIKTVKNANIIPVTTDGDIVNNAGPNRNKISKSPIINPIENASEFNSPNRKCCRNPPIISIKVIIEKYEFIGNV